MKAKKLCQRCGDPATWYSNVSGEDLCTPHYNADVESVSPARPMRPWRWDAKRFMATQESTVEEQLLMLAFLERQCLTSPHFIPSAYPFQPVQPLQGSTLLRMLGFPF